MGRKRPRRIPCQRARKDDRSKCEGSRDQGVTARLPPQATAGKACIGVSLPHALASRSDRFQMRSHRGCTIQKSNCVRDA
jgi:hypothetical protein